MGPSTHKDSTPSGLRRHTDNVVKLKNNIQNDYQYDFFAKEPLKAITTGKEVPYDVTQQMLSADEVGNKCKEKHVTERHVEKTKSMFDNITKNNLKTGIEKTPKTPKPVKALKEDAQGFGILVEQNVPLNEGFKSPVTQLPLSIAESITDLRGATNSSKSRFRNAKLKMRAATVYFCQKSAVWI